MMGDRMTRNDAGLIISTMAGMTGAFGARGIYTDPIPKVWSWEHDKKPSGCDAVHRMAAKNRRQKKQARKKKRGF